MQSFRKFTKILLDPRFVISIIVLWLVIVCILMSLAGFVDNGFVRFGPSSRVKFFRTPIDTWGRWFAVVGYTLINQLIQTYGLETITPWMLNSVQNKKDLDLAFSPAVTQIVIQIWYIYLWTGRIFGIQIMLSQIDFLVVVLFSDLVMTFITTGMYIRHKKRAKNVIQEGLIQGQIENV